MAVFIRFDEVEEINHDRSWPVIRERETRGGLVEDRRPHIIHMAASKASVLALYRNLTRESRGFMVRVVVDPVLLACLPVPPL